MNLIDSMMGKGNYGSRFLMKRISSTFLDIHLPIVKYNDIR